MDNTSKNRIILPAKDADKGSAMGVVGAAKKAARGEDASAAGVLESIGGVRGIVEASLPGVVFLLLFTITKEAFLGAGFAIGAVTVLLLVRILRRENLSPGLSALFGVGLCVLFVLWRGKGSDYYIPGFIFNGVYALALLLSVAFRVPLIGMIAGFLSSSLQRWRTVPQLRRIGIRLTVAWAALMLVRLAVQLPLFYAGNVEGLGVARLVMGLPLYALLLFLTWRVCAAAIKADRVRRVAPTVVT
ncbi:DUF3159 domain-containing protein [Canibacter sp. lx-72]|uniref:DUF3159 domain-containing protein n=1 Tax=Canibacter zhuwentaonis TaxID=2837491 RepID=UPI001BDBE065|nr:DUF3159 domain-containing protein [Canibacter zhuwentaonis]